MVEIKLDEAALARLDGAAKAAALETVEAVKTDLVSSQTMPFDTGAMPVSYTHLEPGHAWNRRRKNEQRRGAARKERYYRHDTKCHYGCAGKGASAGGVLHADDV